VWVPGTVWAPSWVTWSYSDRYVGWAPLPPSVVFGESGYAGRPVVVSQTQYVFVPMNRFVDTDIDSVRVSAQESASIFRQTTPVTSFAVSGGIVRNMAIPMETVQRARGGGRIEPRNIGEARTAPGSMAEGRGTSRQVSVVAPARDVNAAVAAAPKAESRPAQRQQAAPTESRQQRQQVAPAAPRQQRQQAAPTESRQQRQQVAPAAPRQQRQQVAPAESRQQRQQIAPAAPRKEQQQAAPAEPRQQQPRAGAEKPARPAAQAGQPKPQPGHEEPVKKEKDKKDEKQ
jgi:hypothetical protein